jgi:hypothetical protein
MSIDVVSEKTDENSAASSSSGSANVGMNGEMNACNVQLLTKQALKGHRHAPVSA